MRLLGLIAVASLGFNLISADADAAWTKMSGTANQIAVEPTAARHVWKTLNGNVYERNNSTGAWTQRGGAGLNAWLIALPPDPNNNLNVPWILNSSLQIRHWNPGTSSFDAAVPNGGGLGIAVAGTTVWLVGGNNRVYTWNGTSWGEPNLGTLTNVTSIAVDAAGTPWIIYGNQQIAYWNGSSFTAVTAGGGVLAGGAAVLGGNLEFYFVSPGSNPVSWVSAAPGTPTAAQAFGRGGNTIWAIDDANEIYRCVYPNCF